MPSAALIELLSRARSGSIDDFANQGREGSAGWREGENIPTGLLLHDLEMGSLPEDFGSDPLFASIAELDLSGNLLRTLPSGFFVNLNSLRVLFLGGPGPKFTPEGRTCNTLDVLPPLGNLVHLEHLSLPTTPSLSCQSFRAALRCTRYGSIGTRAGARPCRCRSCPAPRRLSSGWLARAPWRPSVCGARITAPRRPAASRWIPRRRVFWHATHSAFACCG